MRGQKSSYLLFVCADYQKSNTEYITRYLIPNKCKHTQTSSYLSFFPLPLCVRRLELHLAPGRLQVGPGEHHHCSSARRNLDQKWPLRHKLYSRCKSGPTESSIWSGIIAPTCQSRPWMRHLRDNCYTKSEVRIWSSH